MFRNIVLFGPESTIVAFLVILFLCDAFLPRSRASYFPLVLTFLGCVFGAWITWRVGVADTRFFFGMVSSDGLSTFFRYFFFFACFVSLYVAYGSKEMEPKSRMEYSILVLCVTFGLCLMAISSNLLMLYIGIETVSIVSFVLAGFNRESLRSNEASFKYLVFGGLASGLMIYGFSLIYGYTGSLDYTAIGAFIRNPDTGPLPFLMTIAFIMTYLGLAYKISAFPMHFWTPDVYEGAPTPVATFFSVGPKAAGFAAFIRLLMEVFTTKSGAGYVSATGPYLVPGIALLSAATMIVGNLSALGQRSVKRILAYSSIAHVGYLLMGLVTLTSDGLTAVLFYLVVYCAMNIGAFWVVSIVADARGSDDLQAFSGMGWQMPVLGVSMGIFLFSLTGIPFFAGFVGKFLLFGAVLKTQGFLWLALLGVANSVVSLYYYVKILKAMWLERPEADAVPERLSLYHSIGIVGLAIPTVILGLFFAPVVRFAQRSLEAFLG